jgi:hypothetical protein
MTSFSPDRDLPFQERWHRKRARFAGRGGACRPQLQGPGFRGQRNSPPCRGTHGHRRGGQFRWQQAGQRVGMDAALKEAIRRSLHDVQVENKEPEPSAPNDKSLPVEDDEAAERSNEATETTEADETAPANDSNAAEPAVEKSAETAERSNEATETTEVDGTVPAIDSNAAEPVVEKSAETSFSSEAVGHGEVAETLGQTLDECAQAIDAMVSELDRDHHALSNEADSDDDDDYTAISELEDPMTEPVTLVENTTEEEASAGEKIVDGEDDNEGYEDVDDKQSETSDDGWQVVHEDEQIASDEVIARAAQLIGSALFQSDLRGSEGGGASTLTSSGNFGGSDSFSVPSSVPSVSSGAQISFAVLDRWALQLSQLHELGFYDDKKNVDILEHLNAGNIGVDADDEISVTQVVNVMLKN